ncbi:MAG: hypothetical protein EOM08_01400 [Clostridia bacterium]|nr:hypothetical protein [Clostridia bacterium]NCC75071.1 hypothetical protein [Clostridia bacterium]
MRTSGNLAYEPEQTGAERALDWASPAPSMARRILLEDALTSRPHLQEKARQIRRELAVRRMKSLLALITLVVLLASIFGGILYRQARILELNFANLKLERQIEKTEQSSGQISESLARQTDLERIRRLAIDRLGLQVPARMQVVTVDIPDSDRVVYARTGHSSVTEEAQLAAVFNEIEGFFKTLELPGQDS